MLSEIAWIVEILIALRTISILNWNNGFGFLQVVPFIMPVQVAFLPKSFIAFFAIVFEFFKMDLVDMLSEITWTPETFIALRTIAILNWNNGFGFLQVVLFIMPVQLRLPH